MGTIAEKLSYLNNTKTAIKNAIIAKGGTVADTDTFRSYAEKISGISTVNNQDKTVTENGVVTPDEGYTGLGSVTVNVPTGGSSGGSDNYLGRIVTEDGVLQLPTENFSFSLPSNVTSIGSYGLQYAFYNCTNLTSTGLNNVTSIGYGGLQDAFYRCTSLTSTGLNNVTSIGDSGLYYAFYNCTNLTSTGLNNVTSIGDSGLYYAFYGCTSLTSTGLNNVTSIGDRGLNNAFRGCTSLTSTGLNNVTSIGGSSLSYAFYGCTGLTSLSFPALNSTSFGNYTNQFNNMLRNVTGCTVHFPSNLESVIGDWSSVTSGFGGTNTTVLFDLPATT